LEKIVINQIKRMLSKREMPQIMLKETAQEGYRVPFGDHPLVGHIAIYSINLILLRLVAGKRSFVFDESGIASHEDGTRPWDRLMHIWRSWFALGNLNGLAAVMLAERTDSNIIVTARNKFQAVKAKSRLHELRNVVSSLGDSVSAGLTGLYLFDPTSDSENDLTSMEQRLASEGFDLGPALTIARLLVLAHHLPDSRTEFVRYARHALEQTLRGGRRDQLESVCHIIVRVVEERMHAGPWIGGRGGAFRDLFDPRVLVEVAMREPRSARIVFDLGRQLHDFEWLDEFSVRFLDAAMREIPSSMFEPDATAWTNWFRLLRDVGAMSRRSLVIHRRMNREFSELFGVRQLVELSKRNPEVALAYFQILQEVAGARNLRRFVEHDMGAEFFARMFHPRQLVELSERSLDAALAYLQILKELGGAQHLKRFVEREMGPEFFGRMYHPRALVELSERNPEAVLAYLQILRELGGGRYLDEKLFQPLHLVKLAERNPEAVLAYMKILRELDSGRYLEEFMKRDTQRELFEQLFHPRDLAELSERNPEAALGYLQILKELIGGRYFAEFVERDLGPEFFERLLHPRYLQELSERRVSELSTWLACARLFDSRHFTQLLINTISEGLRYGAGAKRLLSLLPIKSLVDLRWLSEQTQAPELRLLIIELATSETRN
jgi:hypothetical protein